MNRDDRIYKQHYACIRCRKAFKKTNIQEIPKQRLEIDEHGRIVDCPQCGERMLDVGFDYEAPKQENVKAWAEAEARLSNSEDHAIRNSSVINVQSRRKHKKFIEE